MKVLDQVKKKVQKYLHKKQKPVIIIPRQDPWSGEKWVHVLANNPKK